MIVWHGTRPDVCILEDEDAEVMYDVATRGQNVALFSLDRATFDLAGVVKNGMTPEVVEAEPEDAVPVGADVPQALPPAGGFMPKPAKQTRCERCKRQLIGGVCTVHGRDIRRG